MYNIFEPKIIINRWEGYVARMDGKRNTKF